MREHYEFHMDEKEIRPGKIRRMLKRSLTIALSAAMVAGAVVGTGYLTNRTTVSAAETEKIALLTAQNSEEESTETPGSLADMVEATLPSIVSISTLSVQEVNNYYGMFGFFGGGGYAPIEREVEGGGSGIIIGKNDTELLIVTNQHVIEDVKTLSVTFADNETVEGKVKGYDEFQDVAVVAVPLEDIKDSTMEAISIAKIGNSDEARVGEQVVVIGNAMGYGTSATTGIISAKNRIVDEEGNLISDKENGLNLIQTDAAINPGNSGGAMVNMKGEVIGIAERKIANYLVEGMCYAIAITDVVDEIESIMNEETREVLADDEHGILGISGSTVSEEESKKFGFPAGVYVGDVAEGGAADAAGIKKNSVITKFNGKKVTTIEQLIEYVNCYRPGEEIELTYEVSNDGTYEERTATVILGEQTEEYKAGMASQNGETYEEDDRRDGEKPEGKDDRDNRDDRDDDEDDDDYDDDYEEFFGGEDPYGEGKNDNGSNWPFGFIFGN